MSKGAEALISVVLAEEKAVFSTTGEDAIGLGAAFGDEIVDHDAKVGLVTGEDEGLVTENLEGGVGPGEEALAGGLFIARGPIDLAGKVEALNALCFKGGG